MRFKAKDIRKAMDHLRYQCQLEGDLEVEFRLNEEDIDSNKIGSSLEIKADTVKEPSSYDSCKSSKLISVTIEVFPTHENRPIRSIITETREISSD